MSEVLIDVTWRGLEVGRQVRLHEVTGDHGRLDVALPMPVGSAVKLRAADGLEIPATVTRVHEQSTSGGETAGMVIAPVLDGASAGWWSARAAESAAAPPSSSAARADDEPAVMIVAPADPTARPTMVFNAVGGPLGAPTQATPAPANTARSRAIPASTSPPVIHAPPISAAAMYVPPVTPTPVVAPPVVEAPVVEAPVVEAPVAAPIIQPPVLPPPSAAAAPAVIAAPDGEADRTMQMPAMVMADEVPEDNSRTAIMNAVDVEALIAEGVANAVDAAGDTSQGMSADDSGVVDGPTAGDSAANLARAKPGAPRGKRRRGR